MEIREFQELIARRYKARDQERGVPRTFMWFVEEVGELATALATGTDRANIEEEFADFALAVHPGEYHGRRSGDSLRQVHQRPGQGFKPK
jgi:hypothetical protein